MMVGFGVYRYQRPIPKYDDRLDANAGNGVGILFLYFGKGSVGSLALEYHKSVFTPFLYPYISQQLLFDRPL